MKRFHFTSFIASAALLAFAVFAFGQQKQLFILSPDGTHRPLKAGDDARYVPVKDRAKIQESKDFLEKAQQALFTLTWMTHEPTVNFGFVTGDTLAQWFVPKAGALVKEIRIQVQTFQGSASIDVWGSKYNGECDQASEAGGSEMDPEGHIGSWVGGAWVPGSNTAFTQPPLDHSNYIWGPFPISVTAGDAGTWLTVPTIILGFEPDVGNKPFFVTYATNRTSGWGFGAQATELTPYHFFKFYLSSGRWVIREHTMAVECVVEYYENIAPEIANLSAVRNTYRTGPFAVAADIADFDPDPAQQGVASAYLVYSTNGGATWDSTAMTGPAAGGTWAGEIPTQAPNTTVQYYVSAKDPRGLYSKSLTTRSFFIGQATPGEDFLLLRESSSTYLPSYANVLRDLNYNYDLMVGVVDESVVPGQYKTILVTGEGGSGALATMVPDTLPNQFASFLDAGGNLLLASDEWVGVVGYGFPHWDTPPAIVTTNAGSFSRQYLGIDKAESDGPFSLMKDVPGDGFTDALTDTIRLANAFEDTPYNWFDTLTPTEAAASIYENVDVHKWVESDSFVIDPNPYPGGNSTGIKKSGPGKVIYLPFIFGTLDSTVRAAILKDALTWFGTAVTSVGPEKVAEVPKAYRLTQNYPNPFNPETQIEYAIPKGGDVNLAIYNLLGEKVAELVNQRQEAGTYRITWNGRDAKGAQVASGIYLYRLQSGDFVTSKKMVVMR